MIFVSRQMLRQTSGQTLHKHRASAQHPRRRPPSLRSSAPRKTRRFSNPPLSDYLDFLLTSQLPRLPSCSTPDSLDSNIMCLSPLIHKQVPCTFFTWLIYTVSCLLLVCGYSGMKLGLRVSDNFLVRYPGHVCKREKPICASLAFSRIGVDAASGGAVAPCIVTFAIENAVSLFLAILLET